MLRLFFIFLLLLASIGLGIQLQRDPGYLLIAINHWTLETTLWIAILGVFLLFVLAHVSLLLMHWIVKIPQSISQWSAKRRVQAAQAKTRQGLIEFSEGYWQQAKNHLIKALPDTDTPLLNYLTAARAAQEMGDSKLRDDYLRQAQQSMPEAKIAVELTQAQLQLANKQWEQALATLKHLQSLAPNHPYVLKLLMHLYKEVRDWPQLITLLPELKHNRIIDQSTYQTLQKEAYLQTIIELIKQKQTTTLKNQMTSLPKHLMLDPDLIYVYCQDLLKNQEQTTAEPLLRRSISKQFDEKLISLYGQLQADDTTIRFAESLLKSHPHSAALDLCLGRLCHQQHLWGKAKTYFEDSIRLGATPQAYAALGQLLETLNEREAACDAYRQGLLLTIGES